MMGSDPEVGRPAGLGPFPEWQSNVDARLEGIKRRLRSLIREWDDLDLTERNERARDLWDDVEWLGDDTKSLAKSQGQWDWLSPKIEAAFRTAGNFPAQVHAIVSELQTWLVVNGYILYHEGLGYD